MTRSHTPSDSIRVSAPGRICLFGEHLDYLMLPVIPAAIDLRLEIFGVPNSEMVMRLQLPDIGAVRTFALPPPDQELAYDDKADYFSSVYNVLQRAGTRHGAGWDCTVTSRIPINSGTSSSSALTVAWTRFLLLAARETPAEAEDPRFVGRMAYDAEVREFDEAGGMMDQMASAVGGIMRLDFTDPVTLRPIADVFGPFVLGDSREEKDTQAILGRTKTAVLAAVQAIAREDAGFDLASVARDSLSAYRGLVSDSQFRVLHAACQNRDILEEATRLLNSADPDHRLFGRLLSEHHRILDTALDISTPKINRMLAAAMTKGAYGGKINGSGGGGCMFVYAPENTAAIAQAVEAVGGTAYIVRIDEGVRGGAGEPS